MDIRHTSEKSYKDDLLSTFAVQRSLTIIICRQAATCYANAHYWCVAGTQVA